jgi:transcriptional regulator with XRE-family HTH domain
VVDHTFKSASDAMTAGGAVQLSQIAQALGVAPGTVSRYRSGVLPPPDDWRRRLRDLAIEWAHAQEKEAVRLRDLARELEVG